jgi:hypothetical protein
MADFYQYFLNGGVTREINLDRVLYLDRGPSMDDSVVINLGPGHEIKLEGREARRFVDMWENRWRKPHAA